MTLAQMRQCTRKWISANIKLPSAILGKSQYTTVQGDNMYIGWHKRKHPCQALEQPLTQIGIWSKDGQHITYNQAQFIYK